MKRILFGVCILLTLLTANAFAQQSDPPVLKGSYLGQTPPGIKPEVFAPGVVSTASHEFSCSFTSDGKEFYFTRDHPQLNQKVIMVTKLRDGLWTTPEVVPFVENQFSFEPVVTPDDKKLYFTSGKPIPGETGPPMNILYVEREGDGWSMPKNPGPPFNPMKTMYVSATLHGTLYTTDISEGPGKERIAVLKNENGKYNRLERLGPPIDGGVRSSGPFVAPDESYLIFERPSDKINSLLVSFRKPDGGWSEPRALDLGMKAGLPFVSRDGKFLFFTAGEQGKSDIYWVSAKIIDELRPKNPK